MENLFQYTKPNNISMIFDLKGAVVNRSYNGFDESLNIFIQSNKGIIKGKD
jgi:hypothetical protein